MKVEVLDGLGTIHVLPCTRVLVTDDNGTPLAVASEWMAGAITTAHAGDASFAQVMRALGVDRTTVVERYRPESLVLP